MFLKWLFKVCRALCLFLLILGAAMMDSESLLVPVLCVVFGAAGLSVTSLVEDEYVEF